MAADGSKGELATKRDLNVNAVKAALKLIPGVGDSMIQLFFERGQEARFRRWEETWEEIRAHVADRGKEADVKTADNEDFADFVEKSADPLGRSTNEDKRQRFRDLLYNSLFIPPGDPGWDEAMYCLDLLQKIDSPGLYILASIVRAEKDGLRLARSAYTGATQLFALPFQPGGSELLPESPQHYLVDLRYDVVLLAKSLESLLRETELVQERTGYVTTRMNSVGMGFLGLSHAGRLLVKWTLADF